MKFPTGSRLALAASFATSVGAKVVAFSDNGAKPELDIRLSHRADPADGIAKQTVTIDSGSFHHLVLPYATAANINGFERVAGKSAKDRNLDTLNNTKLKWKVKVVPRRDGEHGNKTGSDWIDIAEGTTDYVADYRKAGQQTKAGKQGLIGLPAMRMMNLQIGFEGNKLVRHRQAPNDRPVVLVRPPHENPKAGRDVDKIFLMAKMGDVDAREFCMVLDTGGPVSSLPDFAVEHQEEERFQPIENLFQAAKKGHAQGAADAVEERPLMPVDVPLRLETTVSVLNPRAKRRFRYTPLSKLNGEGGLYPLWTDGAPRKKTVFNGGEPVGPVERPYAGPRRGNLSVRTSNNKNRVDEPRGNQTKTPPPRYWGILGMPFITDVQPHFLYLKDDAHMQLSSQELVEKYKQDLKVLRMDDDFLKSVVNGEQDIQFLRTASKPHCKQLYKDIRAEFPRAERKRWDDRE